MAIVVGIRFKDAGKVYYFSPAGIPLVKGDHAIVETARGVECGYVSMGCREVADSELVPPLKKVMRKATEADLRRVAENEARQKEAFAVCERKISEHKMDMKLVDVEYTFDNSKILFYFTADGRVDFRDLVKDLAAIFRTRIELRQIGVRDEAKMLGGLGVCGRPFCCSQFLGDFQPVSIKMAKEQGLSLNPVKISGTCGRLMCCLKYEQNAYDDLLRVSPRVGSVINTPDGRCVVTEQNLIAGTVKARPERDPEAAPKTYAVSEVKALHGDRSRPKHPEPETETLSDPELEQLEQLERADRPAKPVKPRPAGAADGGSGNGNKEKKRPPRPANSSAGERKPPKPHSDRPSKRPPQGEKKPMNKT